MIDVRQATAADLDALAPLFDGYRQFYGQRSDIAAARAFLQDRLQQNESVIFLALLAGQAVGLCQLYPIFSSVSMRRAWLLNDLFVDPAGRGQGVGEKLLDAAAAHGRASGAAWLMLQTAQDNLPAQRLYARAGWHLDQHFQSYILDLSGN
ncbi:MAG TPA: GNAT family N-acetyltransferase, partial [Xanthomonadales bacterium]|nr:GNAT family N-acetyltransferase [Xanthomonadales bacterium]